jgi:hypothetical protein
VVNKPMLLQLKFAGVVARVESLRGRMGESARQACAERSRSMEGLFESLLSEYKIRWLYLELS